MWDCRLQSDGLLQVSNEARGSSLSSNTRGSRSWMGSERHTNHHHSVSDGALSYPDSPPDNFLETRWTSPVPKFNIGEVAASTAQGSRLHASRTPYSTERRLTARAAAASPTFGSPSSLSESSKWESSSKRPYAVPNRIVPSRRSYMSKAVYPIMFRNPVSEYDAFGEADKSSAGNGRYTPSEDLSSPSRWVDNRSSMEYKFYKALTELQKLDTSPEPNTSSRRDGFRWSSASSYDLGFDGDRFDIAEHLEADSLRSPTGLVADQKCGVCGKLLCQKSPWSSHRIMRGGDMPIAGVLPCSHVFHAECLEQVTAKVQIHEPPCPMCSKATGSVEESPSVSEPLQMALRNMRRSKALLISEAQGSHGTDEVSVHGKDKLRKSWSFGVPGRKGNGSSITSRLKRHFTFKAKGSKDTSSSKFSPSVGSPSSNEPPRCRMLML